MSLLATDRPVAPPAAEASGEPAVRAPGPSRRDTKTVDRSPVLLVGLWLVVVVVSLWLVLYLLEPLFQQRNQAQLLSRYRASISTAANESNGLAGISTPTKAPSPGSPVGVLEIGGLRLQQVAVEGVGPSQTQLGPGHVPGTAGPGQPGNSVFVGRRATFGAPFGKIDELHEGDSILITTTQGQSVYKVSTVEQKTIRSTVAKDGVVASTTTSTAASSTDTSVASDPASAQPTVGDDVVDRDLLFGKTTDDRLTLVTSDSANPFNSSKATVVTAALEGTPFRPTPQGGRVDVESGTTGDPGAWASLLLALQAFVLTGIAAVFLYRRSSMRVAYLLTVPAFIAFTILFAESVSRLLPAWM